MSDYLFRLFVLSLIAVIPTFAQAQSAEQERREHERKIREQIWKANTEIITGKPPVTATGRNNDPTITGPTVPVVIPRRPPSLSKKELEEIRKEQAAERARIEAERAPHPDDLVKFKEFLSGKDMGLIRLFPDLGCDSKFVVQVGGDCENTLPDSCSYSFQKRQYSDGVFHDIRLHEDRLWIDGFLSQSMITDLGDVPLENVSLRNNYAEFLRQFKPAAESIEARKQFREIADKVRTNGFTYGKVVKPTLNTTYLARFINYRLPDEFKVRFTNRRMASKEEWPFFVATFDKRRVDTIVAFRVVRVDSDDSISVLWKQLAENESPSLQFGKDEKWTDLKIK